MRLFRALRIVMRDERIPSPVRRLAVLALLPIPGPFDEALLVALLPFALVHRQAMREAWIAAAAAPGRTGAGARHDPRSGFASVRRRRLGRRARRPTS